MITQSINIQFTTTSSVQFNRPVQQITLLDASNYQFLRQVMVSNDGVKLIRGEYAIQIPMSQLFAAGFAALPSMSWAPIITGEPTGSTVATGSVSTSTASLFVTASDEAGTDMTYQWYISSSDYPAGWQLPTNTSYVHFQGTSSVNLSASFISGGFPTSPYYTFVGVTNPAGTTSSSVATITLV